MVNKLFIVLINIIILLNNFVYSQSLECNDSDCENGQRRVKLQKRLFSDDRFLLLGAVVLIPLFFVVIIFILMNWAKKNVEKSELKRAQNTNASTLNSLNSLNFSSKNLLYSQNSYSANQSARYSTMESNNNNNSINLGNMDENVEIINSPQNNIARGNSNSGGITSPPIAASISSPVNISSPVSISINSPAGIGSPVGSNIGYGSVYGNSPMAMNTNIEDLDLNSQLLLTKNYRLQGYGNTRTSIMSNRAPTVASVRSPNIGVRSPNIGAMRSPNINNIRSPVAGTPRASNIGNARSPNVSSKFITSPYIQDGGIQQFKMDKSDAVAHITTNPPNLKHTHKLPNVPGSSMYTTSNENTTEENRISVSPPLKDWNDSYNTVSYIQNKKVGRMADSKINAMNQSDINEYVMSLSSPNRISESEKVINIIEQYDDSEHPAKPTSHSYLQDKKLYNTPYNNYPKK